MFDEEKDIVSVVVPVFNEEKYIENFISSLLEQDYPQKLMEWIFVDGNSTDRTKDIIEKFQTDYPHLIKLYINSHKTVPYAMNIGINASKGKYIVRLDAHSQYAKDYISKCILYLNITDADNVGGVVETKSKGYVGKAIALMLSSKFGVGNSLFRVDGKSGYVDTVPFGAFKRETFDKYGMYDVRLTRNQDYEMNYRIRKNGGKIYMSEEIRLTYFCRETIDGITKMAFQNGKWNIITMKLCPGSMSIRHFVPLVYVLSLIILSILSLLVPYLGWFLLAELALYSMLSLYSSLKVSTEMKYIPMLLFLFPLFHISYGIGSISGLLSNYDKQKIK